jgi:hypothetical protein
LYPCNLANILLCQPDLRGAAGYFGTTYDTLENRFRKLKKDAEAMQAEKGEGVAPTPKKNTKKKDPLESTSILHWLSRMQLLICLQL